MLDSKYGVSQGEIFKLFTKNSTIFFSGSSDFCDSIVLSDILPMYLFLLMTSFYLVKPHLLFRKK